MTWLAVGLLVAAVYMAFALALTIVDLVRYYHWDRGK